MKLTLCAVVPWFAKIAIELYEVKSYLLPAIFNCTGKTSVITTVTYCDTDNAFAFGAFLLELLPVCLDSQAMGN